MLLQFLKGHYFTTFPRTVQEQSIQYPDNQWMGLCYLAVSSATGASEDLCLSNSDDAGIADYVVTRQKFKGSVGDTFAELTNNTLEVRCGKEVRTR